MELFKKSVIVGVSVTPEVGLEVAQIDYTTRTVLKYGVRPLEYDTNRREIADLDIFKETLQDLFLELEIPKGAEIVLNIPAVLFKINDYPAVLNEEQVMNAIEEELAENNFFKNSEPSISATAIPSASMQFNKIAYTAAQKTMLMEVAMSIRDLGYKLRTVDTSVSSVLNALIYKERVNVVEDTTWVLLVVESFCCRVLLMSGRNYVDAFEERISIGEVLGDAENYATVVNTVAPLLKNLPAQYLCVVSKTNIVSAEILASKLEYSAPIIHQEANSFSNEAFLDLAPEIDQSLAPIVSLDVIGAAINREFAPLSSAQFNLFNKSLGEIYLMEQPPEIIINGHTYVLSNENLVKLFAIIAVVLLVPAIIALFCLINTVNDLTNQRDDLDHNIAQITKFLKDNENISSDLFDEGDEIRMGLGHNKNIYSYYTIVGTEIPKKLWLTHLKFSDKTTIEGQADNLESIYAFFRSIKDYNPDSDIKLQKLGLASSSTAKVSTEDKENGVEFDTDSILTSLNADFYEFRISNEPVVTKDALKKDGENGIPNATSNSAPATLPDLEPIKGN
mgnify:CR=1 FL=1